jgi:UDP-N-acetylmuramoyl-tripeptide--D-alanyl-D-alanine ligase
MDIQELYSIFTAHPVITTDSRNCPEGSIFIALHGETFDGNAYARQSLEKGCSYAVIDNPEYADPADSRLILVDDCLTTFKQLANCHRQHLGLPIVGITGTNGKTTTKELVTAVLRKKYRVLSTEGNFNNDIGVPKTLVRLTAEDEVGVVEMGASHPGDIEKLVWVADPDYGIITNVGRAHLLGFGSFEGVIKTKGELYDYLRGKAGSKIFINADNPYLQGISEGLDKICYGKPAHKDEPGFAVTGEVVECNPYIRFKWSSGNGNLHDVTTQLIGSYNIDNLLAAAAVGIQFGVSEKDICDALQEYTPSNNRSQLVEAGTNHLIVDAYNANPTSMAAALDNFSMIKSAKKMCILGAMKELGDVSREEHQKCVDQLASMGIDSVWLVGEEFRSANCPSTFRLFDNVDEVKEALSELKPHDYTILIKGSNSTRLFTLPDFFKGI